MLVHVNTKIFGLFFVFACIYIPLYILALDFYENLLEDYSILILAELQFSQLPDVNLNTH